MLLVRLWNLTFTWRFFQSPANYFKVGWSKCPGWNNIFLCFFFVTSLHWRVCYFVIAGLAKIARTIQNIVSYYLFIFAVIQSNTEDILFLSSVHFRDFEVILLILHHWISSDLSKDVLCSWIVLNITSEKPMDFCLWL